MEIKMANTKSPGSQEWISPDQMMRMHRLKMKKRALQARMNRTSNGAPKPSLNITIGNLEIQFNTSQSQKRKNPFLKNDTSKKLKDTNDKITPNIDTSTDSVLFELMKNKSTINKVEQHNSNSNLSFTSVLSKLEINEATLPQPEEIKGESYIPIDWTLNTKMRFMSPKPFAWNGKLKTSEQASGTTGFVRCLDTGEQETTLDTSPNARFHQCCLVWQHPSLPWIELYPRSAGKVSSSLATNSAITNSQFIKDALFSEWTESFRSLFHLLRARQCPYFYVCANTFTALFRAAGICGVSEVHVLLTPTTSGFRQLLKQGDIEYTMPLRPNGKRRSDVTESGYDTLDSNISNSHDRNENSDDLKNDDNEDEDEENLLESLGIEDSEIRKINKYQKRIVLEKESKVDALKQSLVFVKGVDAQALFNFLINCKSAVAVTGALAGVPPTLLAPVAFHSATLKSLKVRESVIRIDSDKFYSLEIKGPILPHVLPSLCSLIKSSKLEEFSISCAQLASTKSFTEAKHGSDLNTSDENNEKKPQSVFGQENLSDCGFNSELLSHFCHPDSSRICNVESLTYSNNGYIWT
ncbi:hypothetical protein PV327_007820 [Microctonus hyperodae]|uniref:Protein downstream neighbor of son homolog n=1 Tax=Microctonus hyperodae TaxID=165561 RepID=A0AA39KZ46_MICHY|nr:hypothetical protein PV327_007820 [Microctonus hyperodae]